MTLDLVAPYRKLVAALVGLACMLAHRHLGLDLGASEAVLVDVILSAITAFGVWAAPNATGRPTG